MSIHLSAEFWSAVEAIGTVAAASLALFFWLWAEHLKPWWQSPKLSLEYENAQPWLKLCDCPHDFGVTAPSGHWIVNGDLVRVRILNKGKTTAHTISVRVMSVCDDLGKPIPGIDPVGLCWSDIEMAGYRVLLSPSDYEYMDLIRFEWNGDFTFHIITGKDSRCEDRGFPAGNYYLTLVGFGDDVKASTRIFRVRLGEVKIEKEGESTEELHYFDMRPVKRIPTR